LQNTPFCPISASGPSTICRSYGVNSNFKPQNTQCIPAFKIFAFLELEQNWAFFKGFNPLVLSDAVVFFHPY
jgi:hypothetical protein